MKRAGAVARILSSILIGLFGLGGLAGLGAISTSSAAVPPASTKSCLPQRTGDLVALFATQPVARKGEAAQSPAQAQSSMVPITRGSPRWMAAFNAVLAWENDDCEAFSAFIEKMGYEAIELRDPTSGHKSWVVLESGKAGMPRRYNGLFALRAPAELLRARRLVISAPLVTDGADGRAAALYQKLDAAALLVSTAERCSLQTCSGCAAVPGYACGGCSRSSDSAHAVDNLLFALFAALEATRTHNGARPYLHFELARKLTPPAPIVGCSGRAAMTEGAQGTPAGPPSTSQKIDVQDGDTYPARFYRGLARRLGSKCVCYHQRERGCSLEETQSVLGRLVNQESPGPFDPCTQEATRLSSRHIHFEWHNVPVETVFGALAEAVPQ